MTKQKNFSFLLLLLFISLIGCQNSAPTIPSELVEHVNTIQQTYAPDKREALFQIAIEQQGKSFLLTGETNLKEAHEALFAKEFSFPLIDQVAVLPSTDQKPWGLTILPVSNLRSKPAYSAELVTQALAGTPVMVLKKEDGWLLIQTPDNYISWVLSGSVNQMDDQQISQWKASDRLILTADQAYVLSEAKSEAPRISTLYKGSLLVNRGTKGNFFEVELPNKQVGYLPQTAATDYREWSLNSSVNTNLLQELAFQLLGRSYLWGGTSPVGMDCSGFIKTLYWSQGIILARDASLQVRHGEAVSLENGFQNLQEGDLLYFGRKATESSPERVIHVAFSLGGANYVHASGTIKINSLDPASERYSEYRKSSLLHARRIKSQLNTPGIQTAKQHPWYN
ncbi:SH3 domain-containing protein [Sunxiuqinia elliptica]